MISAASTSNMIRFAFKGQPDGQTTGLDKKSLIFPYCIYANLFLEYLFLSSIKLWGNGGGGGRGLMFMAGQEVMRGKRLDILVEIMLQTYILTYGYCSYSLINFCNSNCFYISLQTFIHTFSYNSYYSIDSCLSVYLFVCISLRLKTYILSCM